MDNKILYTAKFTHHDLKFHKVWWKSDKRCGSWSGQMDRQTDIQADSYIPPQTMFAGGINIYGLGWGSRSHFFIQIPQRNGAEPRG
jgi:hypothetical protein